MALVVPSALVATVQPLIKRAEEADTEQDPSVQRFGYYLRQAAAEVGIQFLNRNPSSKDKPAVSAFLGDLITKIETERGNLGIPKEQEAADVQFMEKIAVTVFSRANAEDRNGAATKDTILRYRNSATYLECVRILAPTTTTPKYDEMSKYAKARAGSILKDIKAGVPPTPPDGGGSDFDLDAELDRLGNGTSGGSLMGGLSSSSGNNNSNNSNSTTSTIGNTNNYGMDMGGSMYGMNGAAAMNNGNSSYPNVPIVSSTTPIPSSTTSSSAMNYNFMGMNGNNNNNYPMMPNTNTNSMMYPPRTNSNSNSKENSSDPMMMDDNTTTNPSNNFYNSNNRTNSGNHNHFNTNNNNNNNMMNPVYPIGIPSSSSTSLSSAEPRSPVDHPPPYPNNNANNYNNNNNYPMNPPVSSNSMNNNNNNNNNNNPNNNGGGITGFFNNITNTLTGNSNTGGFNLNVSSGSSSFKGQRVGETVLTDTKVFTKHALAALNEGNPERAFGFLVNAINTLQPGTLR